MKKFIEKATAPILFAAIFSVTAGCTNCNSEENQNKSVCKTPKELDANRYIPKNEQ